ncbi:hypothetical protein D3C78_1656750 [compost metagenome]
MLVEAAGAGAAPPFLNASTSSRVILPALPVPTTCVMSIPCSRANLRTLGVARTSRSIAAGATGAALAPLLDTGAALVSAPP